MKVEALKKFRDKYTKELHEKGDIFEVSKKRADEMNTSPAAPLVKEVSEKKSK